METDEGLEVTDEINVGEHVIWQYRGAPYKAPNRLYLLKK